MIRKCLTNVGVPASLSTFALAFLMAAVLGGCSSDSSSHPSPPVNANTTRFGAAEPATLAAAIALAAYPSTTPAQHPPSVTLVGEENWQNAVAAAVLMTPPPRAPMLISSAGGTPGPTNRALETLEPKGSELKKAGQRSREGPPFIVVGAIATPAVEGKTTKTGETAGAVQAATIVALRDSLLRGLPKHVVVAPENGAGFAAPAAAWAAHSGDPVLYARTDKLPAPTVEALKSLRTVPVYVVGPPSAISPSVVREIAKIDKRVKRVSGKTPAENAIALARYSDGSFGWNVNGPGHGFVIARSDAPLDAALAAPLSASKAKGPLLLTESSDRLPKAVREYLLDAKPTHVWVVGDQGAIDATQQAEIDRLAG